MAGRVGHRPGELRALAVEPELHASRERIHGLELFPLRGFRAPAIARGRQEPEALRDRAHAERAVGLRTFDGVPGTVAVRLDPELRSGDGRSGAVEHATDDVAVAHQRDALDLFCPPLDLRLEPAVLPQALDHDPDRARVDALGARSSLGVRCPLLVGLDWLALSPGEEAQRDERCRRSIPPGELDRERSVELGARSSRCRIDRETAAVHALDRSELPSGNGGRRIGSRGGKRRRRLRAFAAARKPPGGNRHEEDHRDENQLLGHEHSSQGERRGQGRRSARSAQHLRAHGREPAWREKARRAQGESRRQEPPQPAEPAVELDAHRAGCASQAPGDLFGRVALAEMAGEHLAVAHGHAQECAFERGAELGLGGAHRGIDGPRVRELDARLPHRGPALAHPTHLVRQDAEEPRHQLAPFFEAFGRLDRRQERRLHEVPGLGPPAR